MFMSSAKSRLIGIVLLSSLFAGRAFAVPVNYSEDVDGDLAAPSGTPFHLDGGINTVAGTMHFSIEPLGGPHFDGDSDGFFIIVPEGFRLSSITFAFNTFSRGVERAYMTSYFCPIKYTCTTSNNWALEEVDLLGSGSVSMFEGILPLRDFAYLIAAPGLGIQLIQGNAGTNPGYWTDYVWTFNVTSVPEPGTLLLIAIGFALTLRRFPRLSR